MEISVKLEGFTEGDLTDRVVRGLIEGLRYKLEAVVHSLVAEVVSNEFRRQLREQFQEILAGGPAVPMRDPENTEEWKHVTLREFVDAYMAAKVRAGYNDRDRLTVAASRAIEAMMPDIMKEFIEEHGAEVKAAAAARLEVELLERIMRR